MAPSVLFLEADGSHYFSGLLLHSPIAPRVSPARGNLCRLTALHAGVGVMNVGRVPANGLSHKTSVLLIDRNAERRALRTKILMLRGIDVVGAADVIEATSMWQPDRYDLVLVGIRVDHRSCIALAR